MNIEVDDDVGDVTLNIDAEDTVENLEFTDTVVVAKDTVADVVVAVACNVLCAPKVYFLLSIELNENVGVVIVDVDVGKLSVVMVVCADSNVGETFDPLTSNLLSSAACRFVVLVVFI